MHAGSEGHFHLRLLRAWQLQRAGEVVPVARRQQRLIAALAMMGPRPRSFICGLLWPESTELQALESLRAALHVLAQQTPGLLVCESTTVGLGGSTVVDLHQLLAEVENHASGQSGGHEDSLLARLRQAELLPGWSEDWVVLEQTRLAYVRFRAYEELAYADQARGNLPRAAEAARAAVELEPLRESAVRLLMRIELQGGHHTAALRAFERFREELSRELHLAPSEQMMRLVGEIRASRGHHVPSGVAVPRRQGRPEE